MTELERLKDRLFPKDGPHVQNFGIFPGDNPGTPEDMAREINKALDAVERGDCEAVTDIDF